MVNILLTARKSVEKMAEIHNELGDIKKALKTQHQDTTNPTIGMSNLYEAQKVYKKPGKVYTT